MRVGGQERFRPQNPEYPNQMGTILNMPKVFFAFRPPELWTCRHMAASVLAQVSPVTLAGAASCCVLAAASGSTTSGSTRRLPWSDIARHRP